MASWLLFAIIYPLLNSIANILDKFLIEKRVENNYSYAIVTGFITLISVLIVYLAVGLPKLPKNVLFFGLLSGSLYGLAYLIYYYVISYTEISRTIGVAYIFPAFVAVLSFSFLGEQLSALKYVAIVVAIIGAILLGLEMDLDKFKLTHAFYFIILNAFLIGIVDVSDKYVLQNLNYWQAYIITTLPIALILILQIFRKNACRQLGQALKSLHLIILTESLYIFGIITFLVAAYFAPISIVSALGALQPAFVFIGMLSLSFLKPKVLKEITNQKVLMYKIIGIIAVVSAAIILSL